MAVARLARYGGEQARRDGGPLVQQDGDDGRCRASSKLADGVIQHVSVRPIVRRVPVLVEDIEGRVDLLGLEAAQAVQVVSFDRFPDLFRRCRGRGVREDSMGRAFKLLLAARAP